MLPSAIFFLSFLNLLLLGTSADNCSSPTSSDPIILLNCGTSSKAPSMDRRLWNGDSNSKFISSNLETSSESKATKPPNSDSIPYMTARISESNFSYTIRISPGPKFIRLYFYPAIYTNTSSNFDIDTSNSLFTVTANNYILLKNYSASLDVNAFYSQGVAYKEFIVTVQQNQTLYLTFSPSPNSLAFINGIEIVPVPDNLYIKNDKSYPLIDSTNLLPLDSFTALETIYRLNVGGSDFTETNAQIFRQWADDTFYLVSTIDSTLVNPNFLGTKIQYTTETPCYMAPEVVYTTVRSMGQAPEVNLQHNLTWKFLVDSGFNYLVRLHFCETDQKNVNATSQRQFSIFINNMTAEKSFDVFFYAPRNDIPVHRDYVVIVPEGNERKRDLWLALHPRSGILFSDPILNGVEIFKLSKPNGDLSGLNPLLPPTPEQPSSPKESKQSKSRVIPIIGALLGAVFTLCLLMFFFVYLRKAKKKNNETTYSKSKRLPFSDTTTSDATPTLLLPTDLCRQFTMPEIQAATRNFHDENVIGCGGFGSVYKGFIQNGSVSVPVAIKRLGSSSKQGFREFHTEIQMLSRLRHAHLVSLIGYCDDQDEMVLVYEFMGQGNLQDHIYKAKKVSIPWKQRLQICIGAAKGLHYLHTGSKYTIIHRDVKSSNILLDTNWMAKVSDFGLSKLGPADESETHVSTLIKGTLGYLDPEYCLRQQITDKSDVYSFGVVLLEVIYGRAPIISTETREEVNLVNWNRKCSKKGTIAENIDPQLKGEIATVCLNKFMEIAESCVRDKATERPTIGDVVWGLEFALQLQEEKNVDGDDIGGGESQRSSYIAFGGMTNRDDDHDRDLFTSSSAPTLSSTSQSTFSNNDSGSARPENVFSQIMNEDGR